jgi:hypothetical protein
LGKNKTIDPIPKENKTGSVNRVKYSIPDKYSHRLRIYNNKDNITRTTTAAHEYVRGKRGTNVKNPVRIKENTKYLLRLDIL